MQVEETVLSRKMTDLDVSMLQGLVLIWLFVAVMSTLATRIMCGDLYTQKNLHA